MKNENYFVENVETTVSYEPQIFGPVAYLTITTEMTVKSYEIARGLKTGLSTKENKVINNVGIHLSYYTEQKQLHGWNPIWIREIPHNKIVYGLSEEFVTAYKNGRYYLCDYKNRENKTPLIDLLKAGKFDLLGRDGTGQNGTIIGADGLPVMHNLYFDYVSAGLFSKKFRIKPLFEHLQANPDVFDLEIEEVPYYNAEDGTKALVFGYKVTPELHKEFTDKYGYYSSNFEVRQQIFDLLGVEKFRKEEEYE